MKNSNLIKDSGHKLMQIKAALFRKWFCCEFPLVYWAAFYLKPYVELLLVLCPLVANIRGHSCIDGILVFVKYRKIFFWGKFPNLPPLPHHGFEGVKRICNSNHFRIAYVAFSSAASTPNTTVKLFFSLFVVCVVCSFTLYQSVFCVSQEGLLNLIST